MRTALLVILGHVLLVLLLSWVGFRRCRLNRPAIGVMNMGDVAIMLAMILLIPILFQVLPAVVMIALLTVAVLSGLYILLEAVIPIRPLTWLLVLLLIGADLGALYRFGAASTNFFAVNNVVQVLVIASVVLLWAQSGMKAGAVATLGLALMVYDFVFTALLPFMGDLFDQLQYVPFSPMIAWRTGVGNEWVAIGFGDLAMAAVFPLVMRKAFGQPAGLLALASVFVAIVIIVALSYSGLVGDIFPLMVVLGPVMAGQFLIWRRRNGRERTTWEYLQADPL